MKNLLWYVSAVLLAASAYHAPAWADAAPRSITVSGEAHEEVAPDQAVLSLSLVSKDVALAKAKQRNDALAVQLSAIAAAHAIPKEKLAISSIYIHPDYSYSNENGEQRQKLIGYTVSRSFRITIDALNDYERLLSALVDAGISDVGGLDFQLSDTQAHAAPLRLKAYEQAHAKALALAQAAGCKLGAPLSITTEENNATNAPVRPMLMRAMAAPGAAPQAPATPGTIALHEIVNVVYSLE